MFECSIHRSITQLACHDWGVKRRLHSVGARRGASRWKLRGKRVTFLDMPFSAPKSQFSRAAAMDEAFSGLQYEEINHQANRHVG